MFCECQKSVEITGAAAVLKNATAAPDFGSHLKSAGVAKSLTAKNCGSRMPCRDLLGSEVYMLSLQMSLTHVNNIRRLEKIIIGHTNLMK